MAAGIVIAQLPTSQAAGHHPGTRVRLTLRPDPVLVTTPDAAGGGAGAEVDADAAR